jgi:hypothetical protein
LRLAWPGACGHYRYSRLPFHPHLPPHLPWLLSQYYPAMTNNITYLVTDAKTGFTTCKAEATELMEAASASNPLAALNFTEVAGMLASGELVQTGLMGMPQFVPFDEHGANCSAAVEGVLRAARGG